MRASFWGKVEAVRWLLDHGADWRRVDGDGLTALGIAVSEREPEAAEVLRSWVESHGTAAEKDELKQQQRNGALVDAVRKGGIEDVRRLLKEGVDVNRTDECGQLPLVKATYSNNSIAVMEALVGAGFGPGRPQR